MALLSHGLLPASFRGAPFAVTASEVVGGRRVALHQYPNREEPWAEDMGREARRFRFRGFIVDGDVVFAGGPIQLQRTLLLAALEKAGPGTLTHPTLGVLSVSVPRFAIGEDLGAGRSSSVDIEFVEAGKQQFPSLLSRSSGLFTAANLVRAGMAINAVRAIAVAAGAGGRRKDLSSTAALWSSRTLALAADATSAQRLAATLPGNFGRFAAGGNGGADQRRSASEATIRSLISAASIARTSVRAAVNGLAVAVAAADLRTAGAIPTAAQAIVDSLVDACADPTEVIRLLEQLLRYEPARPEPLTPIGRAFSVTMRQAAVAALATAAAAYQPGSNDEAAAMINRLASLVDTVATDAADAGDEQSFSALRAVRSAIVEDLRRRAAPLARLRLFAPDTPVPSIVLAQRYYRDPARAAQIERRAGPVHPLFMPGRFQALAA